MWLAETLRNRSKTRGLPTGMPSVFEEIEVTTERTGKSGRILFSLETSMSSTIQSMPNMVQIEYGDGDARIGMGERYTITMLNNELCAVIGDDWGIYPSLAYRRLLDGTVRHHTTANYDEISGAVEHNIMFELPEKIQEDAGRGTEIVLTTDQLRLSDYWAQAGQTALVGVALQTDNRTVEFWMPMTIDPIACEPLEAYLVALQLQWQEKIRQISPSMALCFDSV